ncbi:hypothetical protein ACFWFC_17380, partial [Streptomyces venezuelae]|uniref:hypothetical protein n=1 Tax=Streptomyces venezuelae TaxID=54571 RepID=UPI00365C88D0
PVVLPETIVVDRGKVFVSAAFTAACESLGISVGAAPPRPRPPPVPAPPYTSVTRRPACAL